MFEAIHNRLERCADLIKSLTERNKEFEGEILRLTEELGALYRNAAEVAVEFLRCKRGVDEDKETLGALLEFISSLKK